MVLDANAFPEIADGRSTSHRCFVSGKMYGHGLDTVKSGTKKGRIVAISDIRSDQSHFPFISDCGTPYSSRRCSDLNGPVGQGGVDLTMAFRLPMPAIRIGTLTPSISFLRTVAPNVLRSCSVD